jgi:hypothetical protein
MRATDEFAKFIPPNFGFYTKKAFSINIWSVPAWKFKGKDRQNDGK